MKVDIGDIAKQPVTVALLLASSAQVAGRTDFDALLLVIGLVLQTIPELPGIIRAVSKL